MFMEEQFKESKINSNSKLHMHKIVKENDIEIVDIPQTNSSGEHFCANTTGATARVSIRAIPYCIVM
jgi:hypothetical protein